MTSISPEQDRADALADDIERFAAFVRANPEVADRLPEQRFLIYLTHASDPKTQMADFIRRGLRAGARIGKDVTEKYASASLWFGRIELYVYASREVVCERVVTGTHEETVTEPDADALAAVPKVTKTVVVEDVEWRCAPLLAAAEAESAVSA